MKSAKGTMLQPGDSRISPTEETVRLDRGTPWGFCTAANSRVHCTQAKYGRPYAAMLLAIHSHLSRTL